MKKKLKIGDLVYNKTLNYPFLIENQSELETVISWWGTKKGMCFCSLNKTNAKVALDNLNKEMRYPFILRKMLNRYLRKNK